MIAEIEQGGFWPQGAMLIASFILAWAIARLVRRSLNRMAPHMRPSIVQTLFRGSTFTVSAVIFVLSWCAMIALIVATTLESS